MSRPLNLWVLCSTGLVVLLLTGCSLGVGRQAPGAEDTPYFHPPTAGNPTAENVSAQIQATSEIPAATACTNDLVFISDVTYPDNTPVEPGQSIIKQWEVQNSGTCDWDENYRLRLVAGPSLGAGEEQALYPALSGSTAVIEIQFTASDSTGQVISAWQAYDPNGQPFGEWIYIIVDIIAP
ncbi:MAG TPA: NBR1-Ig-like domain-containing protein [Longilinea sp.]|nr:NBR1-Ig-like domain-containing protein [Longilinea sp.]